MKITKELLEEAKILEDALDALAGGYYDTHDLVSIEENKEEYGNRILELRLLFDLKDNEFFCNFTFEELKNKIKSKKENGKTKATNRTKF